MATRIEKIFRLSTIKAMNSILNEVNVFVEIQNEVKRSKKSKDNLTEEAMLYSHIAHIIDRFYEQHEITDEEVQRAIKKGK